MVYGIPTATDVSLLKTHHRWSVEVYILNTSRQYLFDMSDSLLSGVVDIDVEASTSRSGRMALLDPQQRLSIDFNGIGWGANLSNRMVQIIYKVQSMDYSYTYRCPIFTGPITKFKRDGVVINIEFAGLEAIMSYGQLNDYSWPAGWSRAFIAINAARLNGLVTWNVQDYTYPNGGGAIGAPWTVQGGENLWARLKELADAGAFNLFFNGEGILQLRPKSRTPVFTIDQTWLTEEPDFDLDTSKIRNVVRVEGATIPGTDQKLSTEAWPSPDHPFSPQSLAFNGAPRVQPQRISDTSLATWGDVVQTAWANLEWNLLVAESNSAVCPVIPFLEEYDVVEINHPQLWSHQPMVKASIPLVGDSEMSFNTLSTTSTGSLRGGTGKNSVQPSTYRLMGAHGPSGAFNALGGQGNNTGKSPTYNIEKLGGKTVQDYTKGKKKKNKGKGRGGR